MADGKKFLSVSQVAAIAFGAGRGLRDSILPPAPERVNMTYADLPITDKVGLNERVAERLKGGKSSSENNGDDSLTDAGDALFDGIVKALKPFVDQDADEA